MDWLWRHYYVGLLPFLLYVTLVGQVDSKLTVTPRSLPCTYLPDNPTWNNLVEILNRADFAYLCPFTITGPACPSSTDDPNRIFTVEAGTDLSLICDVTSTVNAGCVIDCPLVRFVVKGSCTIESMTFRNYLDSAIVVEGSFTSKASTFQNGASGAIQGGVSSSISIIQGSVISANQQGGVTTQGKLEIDGSTFSGQRGGAAVYVGPQSDFIITGCTFRDNEADIGPAVVSDADPLQAEFSNNRACNNIATSNPDASCQGILFRSTMQCLTFGKGCQEACSSFDILCIVRNIVNLIIENFYGSFDGGGGRY